MKVCGAGEEALDLEDGRHHGLLLALGEEVFQGAGHLDITPGSLGLTGDLTGGTTLTGKNRKEVVSCHIFGPTFPTGMLSPTTILTGTIHQLHTSSTTLIGGGS